VEVWDLTISDAISMSFLSICGASSKKMFSPIKITLFCALPLAQGCEESEADELNSTRAFRKTVRKIDEAEKENNACYVS
jgi:hypothetical protein